MKSRIASVFAFVIFALTPFACSTGPEEPQSGDNLAYVNPTGDEFPILAWFSILPDSCQTQERYLELREAGFNISFSHFSTPEQVEMAFKACKGTGVKLMVTCEDLETNTVETVNRFKDEEDLAGWFLRDEPVVDQFPPLKEFRDRIVEADREHLLYLNLLPSYVNPADLGTKDYEEYVQRFVDDINLNQLSYDNYPIIVHKGDTVLREDFYNNLEIVRKVARRNGQPFWAFALSTAHTPYPIPTAGHLRLETFSSLAYGSQCLQYFTYWTPLGTRWNFHNAPIDVDGSRTDVYYLIKDLNKEVQSLSWVFLGAEATDVSHTGEQIPNGTKKLESLPEPFTSIESDGPGLLVSRLVNGKNRFLMIVNRDLHETQSITVAHSKKLRRVLPDGKTVKVKAGESGFTLAPGDYVLYRY